MKKKSLPRESDTEIERLRALFAGANQTHQPKGIRGFFHRLAERLARPQKRIMMKRIREAEPVKPARKKDAA
jgi:hypothetical protein